MMPIRAGASLLLLIAAAAAAAPRTVTLHVPGMTCVTCPITVKRALLKVRGVARVDVSYERREAVVTFDDAVASEASLLEATSGAGYPATVKPAPERPGQ